MKKILIVIAMGLIFLALWAVVFKNRRGNNLTPGEAYRLKNPADPAIPQLQRLAVALSAHPAIQNSVLARVAPFSVQDGSVSAQEAAMLQEAAVLAEKDVVSEQQLNLFSAKYPELTVPATEQTSTTPTVAASSAASTASATSINSYIEKHPSGRGVPQLRRLSTAIQARPVQNRELAETVARSTADGSISKEEAVMLDEAADLAEQEGLTPREMAEFSRKYAQGMGLSQKARSASIPERTPAAPLPSFEGKRQLTYTFTGIAQCARTACSDIQVSVRVTSGKWVETREGTTGSKGQYSFQMPVMSEVNEKVKWHLEAHSKDLREAKLDGEHLTTAADRDMTIQNNLMLGP